MKKFERMNEEEWELANGLRILRECMNWVSKNPDRYFCKWIFMYYRRYPEKLKTEEDCFLYKYTKERVMQNYIGKFPLEKTKEQIQRCKEEALDVEMAFLEDDIQHYGKSAKFCVNLLRQYKEHCKNQIK